MELRPYQSECLEAIESKFKEGINRQLVVLPTGSGKTIIFSELLKRKNLKTLVIAHRIELLEQAEAKINAAAPDMETGIFCGDRRCHQSQVTIASIQSAQNHLGLLKSENYELIIIDEAHHAAAKGYKKLLLHLGFIHNPNEESPRLLVGFTATPSRGDGKGLDEVFQEVIYHLSIKRLINQGYLVKPEGLHVTVGIDLRKIAQRMGDFQKSQLQKIMLEPKALQVVIDTIKSQAADRRGIVFSVNIQHAKVLNKLIQDAGFSCDTVHSKVDIESRKQRLKDFSSGKLQFIVNPLILTEGFDCPRADCMINAAPTLNRSLYVQKAGRVLRLHDEKDNALLIDFGFSKRRHALRTAIDLYGDANVRKIRDRKQLNIKEKTTNPEKVDFSNTEFKKSEKEAYDPTESVETFEWEKLGNNETYSLQGVGVKLIVKRGMFQRFSVMRIIESSGEKEGYGFHKKDAAFELAESLIEKETKNVKKFKLIEPAWRKEPATENQLGFLKKLDASLDISGMTKGQASDYIHKLKKHKQLNNKEKT